MIDKVEVVKIVPPAAVAASEFLGLSLPEWVLLATFIYTVIQIYLALRKVFSTDGAYSCTNDSCPGRQRK